jgi:hypothetical protein
MNIKLNIFVLFSAVDITSVPHVRKYVSYLAVFSAVLSIFSGFSRITTLFSVYSLVSWTLQTLVKQVNNGNALATLQG